MSNDKDLLQEVNKAIADILEAMLQAMLKVITEQKRMEQEFLVQVYRSVGKEMGNQLAKQLREQMNEVKISKVELPRKSGNPSQSLHLVHDQDGKSYKLDGLDEKGKIELSSTDGKGKNIHLDPKELGFSPKVEHSLLASTNLAQKNPHEVVQVLNQAIQQSRVDGRSLTTHFCEQMNLKLQPDMVKGRLNDLEMVSNTYRAVEFEKLNVEHRLNAVNEQLALTEGKGELTQLKSELQIEQQTLTGQLQGYEKWLTQADYQINRDLQTHCPELTDKSLEKLDFHEKTALGQTAFSQSNSLTNDQLRDEMKEKRNDKGLDALNKAEGREQEMKVEETTIEQSTEVTSTMDI